MGNNKKLAKLGIIVTAVVIVFGVALFVFKGQENKVEPVETDFRVTRIQEDTPNEVGLIENESKFNEVETETVEDIEEIVDKAIEEIDKEDSDHLEGITVHSKEDADSADSEKADSEKDGSIKENLEKTDSEQADSEKSDSKKGNNEQSDSSKSDSSKADSDKSDSIKTDSSTDKTTTEKGSSDTSNENNGQINNGEKNTTVEKATSNQSVAETPSQTVPQTQSSDDQMRALFGDAYMGDGTGHVITGYGGSGNVE